MYKASTLKLQTGWWLANQVPLLIETEEIWKVDRDEMNP